MRRIVRLDLALLILLWSVGYSLFIFADSLRRPLIPHRESASGLVQEYGVFQSREDSSDSLGGNYISWTVGDDVQRTNCEASGDPTVAAGSIR